MNRWAATALFTGGVLGLLGVAAGAFGAHGLREVVEPSDLEIWRTAAHYEQIHALALVALAMGGRRLSAGAARFAIPAFIAGILIFSGTLYAIVLGGPRVLGAITPVGGLSLMVGWLLVAVHGFQWLRHRAPPPPD